jgi:hypothetical protein
MAASWWLVSSEVVSSKMLRWWVARWVDDVMVSGEVVRQ